MNNFEIARRNTFRNPRRSFAAILGVAVGFASVSLFAGYTQNIFDSLSRLAIRAELLGHVTVQKRDWETKGRIEPKKYLFNQAELTKLKAAVSDMPHVQRIIPKLAINGVISNGVATTIFIAQGIDPADGKAFQQGTTLVSLSKFQEGDKTTAVVAQGLADILNLKIGDSAALLVSTVDGQANAMDVDIKDTFTTFSAGTNDKFLFVPLSLARDLYDVPGGADQVSILLDDKSRTESFRIEVQEKLRAAGLDVDVKTWQEMSAYYRQVKTMLTMVISFITGIVVVSVLLSLINTLSMIVVERTREIGTLRALGLKQGGVSKLFAIESAYLVLAGCFAGLAITLLVRTGLNALEIQYTPPNSSNVVALVVGFDWIRTLVCFVSLMAVGLLAAIIPARNAARKPIIDALAHT